MPLFVSGCRAEGAKSTCDFMASFPHLQEGAEAFRTKAPVDVDPKCVLYVNQREYAATLPTDCSVSVLGSDDATTCHVVVVRHTGSGATCLAHCDGSRTATEVSAIVKAVTALSDKSTEGRLELHLIGGFDDDRKLSQHLSLSLLEAFGEQTEDIHLITCCITEQNDILINGVHKPVVYGIGTRSRLYRLMGNNTLTPVCVCVCARVRPCVSTAVNVKDGDVFPASFSSRGPAEDLRSARTFTGGQMVNIYDCSRELVMIGPCWWSPDSDLELWLQMDDRTILKYLSTSPRAEPPHFVQHMRSTIRFLLEHPSSDALFPGGQAHVFYRTDGGDWERVTQKED